MLFDTLQDFLFSGKKTTTQYVGDVERVSSPCNTGINTQPLLCPLPFSTGSHRSKRGLTRSEQSVEPFRIHVFAQNSVKAGGGGSRANWGISGKQVSSHFILYESKCTPGLGLRTMPPERDAIHLTVHCKNAAAARLVREGATRVPLQGCVKRECKVSTSELIMAHKLSASTSGRVAVAAVMAAVGWGV